MAPALRMTRSIKEKLPVFFYSLQGKVDGFNLIGICKLRWRVRSKLVGCSPRVFFFFALVLYNL